MTEDKKEPGKMHGGCIAERSLQVHHADGSTGVVRIEIERPEKCGDGDDYRCRYSISGLDRAPRRRFIYGSDSLQALVLCIKTVSVELSTAQEKHRLTWPGTNHDDLLLW